jgi:hopene-associated glycosyltransferase HpnB
MSSTLAPAVAAIVLAFWLALRLDARRRWPHDLRLPASGAGGSELSSSAPAVVALVPARDEAETLPLTLPSLLAQRGLRGVVLVDDGSSDGTAPVARAHAAATAIGVALEVVTAPARPAGWAGKVHAQAVGLDAARRCWPEADWLLLTDADIRLREGAVADLLAQAALGFDLVSVMARLRTVTIWEKLLVPAFVYFFQLLYPFREVPRRGERTAAAAGGCVLVRRASLERAGGFDAIRSKLIDDVALAKAVARAGGRAWLGLDAGVESVRPYPRLRDVWRMVARSAFVQLDYRWSLVLATLGGLFVFFVLPPIGLAAMIASAVTANGASAPWLIAAVCWLASWSLQTLELAPAVRHHRLAWPWALVLPAASLLYALMTLSSALTHLRGHGPAWSGRRYDEVGSSF